MHSGEIFLSVIPLTAAHLTGLYVVGRGLKHVDTLIANGADAVLEVPGDPAAGTVFILSGSVFLTDLTSVRVNPHTRDRCFVDHAVSTSTEWS